MSETQNLTQVKQNVELILESIRGLDKLNVVLREYYKRSHKMLISLTYTLANNMKEVKNPKVFESFISIYSTILDVELDIAISDIGLIKAKLKEYEKKLPINPNDIRESLRGDVNIEEFEKDVNNANTSRLFSFVTNSINEYIDNIEAILSDIANVDYMLYHYHLSLLKRLIAIREITSVTGLLIYLLAGVGKEP